MLIPVVLYYSNVQLDVKPDTQHTLSVNTTYATTVGKRKNKDNNSNVNNCSLKNIFLHSLYMGYSTVLENNIGNGAAVTIFCLYVPVLWTMIDIFSDKS